MLNCCVKEQITIEQYMFLFLTVKHEFADKKSIGWEYIKHVGKFEYSRVIEPLINRGYILDLNSEGKKFPEFFVPSERTEKLFASTRMGEEFWDAYPKVLPLGGKGSFVSRAGIQKDDLIEEYLRKINYDPDTHITVMSKLRAYENMVKKGKINGHKIVNFVREEIWEVIEDKDVEDAGTTWGTDI